MYNEFYVGQGIGHELDPFVFSLPFGGETLLDHNVQFLINHLVDAPEPSSFSLAVLAAGAMIAKVRRRRR